MLIGAIVKLAVLGSGGHKQIVQLHGFFVIHGSLRAEAFHEVIDVIYHWIIPFWFLVWVLVSILVRNSFPLCGN